MPFISFTDEQIRLANSVDLPEFLINRGETIKRIGKQYKFIYYDESGEHDSITLSGSVWFDHKNQIGGGPIRFMKIHYGLSFQDAMQALLGYAVFPEIHKKYDDNIKKEEKKDFRLPETNTNMQRVYAYLIKQRYIKPEIISFFVKNHTIYEEKKYHNVVFVGLDEKGIPRQAHKRSTTSYGKTFRITCEGSDTRYSFSHYGDSEKLYVFEAPIDLLSYLSLYTNDWQKNSYIAMNGVYENAVLTALTQHDNIREIIICTDNDEGGIDAAERLSDILKERGYERILRCLPKNKDWNEDLKEMNGAEYLPAVPHRRKKIYANTIDSLKIYNCSPEKLSSRLYSTYINGQYKYLAEYALTGSVYFFFKKTGPENGFLRLKHTMKGNYRPYTDKGTKNAKIIALKAQIKEVTKYLQLTSRTREQEVETARKLYKLADCSLRVITEDIMSISQQSQEISNKLEQNNDECISLEIS